MADTALSYRREAGSRGNLLENLGKVFAFSFFLELEVSVLVLPNQTDLPTSENVLF